MMKSRESGIGNREWEERSLNHEGHEEHEDKQFKSEVHLDFFLRVLRVLHGSIFSLPILHSRFPIPGPEDAK
jgi:hypothetical protein